MLHTRIMSVFHPPRLKIRLPVTFLKRWNLVLIVASLLLFPLVLAIVPTTWIGSQTQQFWDDWFLRNRNEIERFMQYLEEPNVPAFNTIEDPQIIDYLQNHPLIVALASSDGKVRFVRDGNRLRTLRTQSENQRLAHWLDMAMIANQASWSPSGKDHPDYLREAIYVIRSGSWFVVYRWTIGSPAVEQLLRQRLGGNSRFRVGIRRANRNERQTETTPLWSLAPNLQAECPKDDKPGLFIYAGLGRSNQDPWEFIISASWQDLHSFESKLLRWKVSSYGACLLIPGVLLVGLLLQGWLQQRERLEMDRMASMAHSLKTPLGVLKLRCDSIRLGQFNHIQTEIELLKISEEVDKLATFINQALKGFRDKPESHERTPLPPSWFQAVAEDLEPIFKLENRQLELRLDAGWAMAHPPSLKTALVTLLENALVYGDGIVTLRTRRRGGCLHIQVQDQGKGLDANQLDQVGKPFTRFRVQGGEGFQQEGWGLGLFLLASAARQERWGFAISSGPGEGLQAFLDVPSARQT